MWNTNVGCDARSPGGDYITVMWYRRRQAYLHSLKQEEQRHLNITLEWRKQLRPCWPWWWWCHEMVPSNNRSFLYSQRSISWKAFVPWSFSGPPNTPKGVYLEKLLSHVTYIQQKVIFRLTIEPFYMQSRWLLGPNK